MEDRFCPHDGALMKRDEQPLTLTCEGRSATAQKVSGWYCSKCDEAFFDSKGSQTASRLLNGLRAEIAGVLMPVEICRIRKKLGLTQKDAGLIIGGGLRAFQKYESGDVLLSRGIDSVLRLLDRDPSQLSFLKELYAERLRRMYHHPASQARRDAEDARHT